MKMRHKTIAVSNEPNNLIRQQIGFNGRNAITTDIFYFIKLEQKFIKIFSDCASVIFISYILKITQIHTGQHNFLYAVCCKMLNVLNYIINRIAPALAARHGYGAERTTIIASVLHF